MSAATHILIFARAPVAGACKTRLIPALGAEGAAQLHARLVEHTLHVALESRTGPVSLFCAGGMEHPFFISCAAKFGVTLRAQCDGDLGARMLDAFRTVNAPALLAGSDLPCITPQDLRNCALSLSTHDAVFLPAEDGGYGLAGLRKPQPGIFNDMIWSTADVMQITRARMRDADMTWAEPRMVWDVDGIADLQKLTDLERLQEINIS